MDSWNNTTIPQYGVPGISEIRRDSLGISVYAEPIVSDSVLEAFKTIVYFWLCLIMSMVGIVTNALVISTFTRQGFKDSVSVSLTSIACMDMIVCLTGWAHKLYGIVGYFNPALAQSWNNVSMVILLHGNHVGSLASDCMASYVSLERCVCVSFPFGVKTLFRPKRTLIVMLVTCGTVSGSIMVIPFSTRIYPVFSPVFNQTILIFGFSKLTINSRETVLDYYNVISMLWPFLSFVIILFCTFIIILKLRQSSKFRSASIQPNLKAKPEISQKDVKVAKMLLVVIIVYLIDLVPRLVSYTLRTAVEDFGLNGKEENLFYAIRYAVYLFNIMNASVNFFIYLKMSTSFRVTFLSMMYGKGVMVYTKKVHRIRMNVTE